MKPYNFCFKARKFTLYTLVYKNYHVKVPTESDVSFINIEIVYKKLIGD